MKSSEKQIEKVDQLFKNKLDDHAIMPYENAWARVEGELSKKNKWFFMTTQTSGTAIFWRSAAAVLLVGALASVVYWSQSGNEKENVLAKKSPIQNEKKEVAQTPTKAESKVEATTQNKNDINKKVGVNRFANTERVAQKEVAQEKQPSESQKAIIEIEREIATIYTIKMDRVDSNQGVSNEEKIKEQATPQAQVASIKQKPIKLEFTLEALPSEETVATTTEVKSTGIKKVLNLAREMKEGDGLSLREKKDELLANNFLTKRERNQ